MTSPISRVKSPFPSAMSRTESPTPWAFPQAPITNASFTEMQAMVVFLEMNERAPFAPQTQASGEWMSAGLQVAPRLADACYSLRRDGPVLTVASTREQLPAEEAD